MNNSNTLNNGNNITIAIKGHKPNKLIGGYDRFHEKNIELKNTLVDLILYSLNKYETVTVKTGMGLGVDQLFMEAVSEIKSERIKSDPTFAKRLIIEAHVPIKDFSDKWIIPAQNHYHRLLKHADSIKYYDANTTSFYQACRKRNNGLLENTDVLFTCYNGYSKNGEMVEVLKLAKNIKGLITYNIPGDYYK